MVVAMLTMKVDGTVTVTVTVTLMLISLATGPQVGGAESSQRQLKLCKSCQSCCGVWSMHILLLKVTQTGKSECFLPLKAVLIAWLSGICNNN